MLRTTLAAVLALLSLPASAALPKEHVRTGPDACTPVIAGSLQVHPLWLRNVSAAPVDVVCGASLELGQNGTTTFGAVITNTRGDNRSVTCTAFINSGGQGVTEVARSVLVGPHKNKRIHWTANDMGWNVFAGGQGGFQCTLPPGMAIQWVYTITLHN
jgi:hypothetical protein